MSGGCFCKHVGFFLAHKLYTPTNWLALRYIEQKIEEEKQKLIEQLTQTEILCKEK